MPEISIADRLVERGVRGRIIEWASVYGHDLKRAWEECPQFQWLVLVAAAHGTPRNRIKTAADAALRLEGTLLMVAPVPGAKAIGAPFIKALLRTRVPGNLLEGAAKTYWLILQLRFSERFEKYGGWVRELATNEFRRVLPAKEVITYSVSSIGNRANDR